MKISPAGDAPQGFFYRLRERDKGRVPDHLPSVPPITGGKRTSPPPSGRRDSRSKIPSRD